MSFVMSRFAPKRMKTSRIVAIFIALAYPVTIVSSVYYAYGKRSPAKDDSFHVKRDRINILEKSNNIQLNRKNIETQILNVYNGRPDYKTELIYAADATFEDPILFCKGVKSITCVIHGLPIFSTEMKTMNEEIEHFEDAMVIKFDYVYEMGPMFRDTVSCIQYLELNQENNQIEKHKDLWNGRNLYEFKNTEKVAKYINGNFIARLIFGLSSGRFIE